MKNYLNMYYIKINNEINESKNEVSKTTILDIHGSKYNVEYTINNSEKTLKNYVEGKKVVSPLEGKVYLTKKSSQNALVVGDKINKGDTICYIESMKVINAIKTEHSGEIVQICFSNGDEILDDDILFVLK